MLYLVAQTPQSSRVLGVTVGDFDAMMVATMEKRIVADFPEATELIALCAMFPEKRKRWKIMPGFLMLDKILRDKKEVKFSLIQRNANNVIDWITKNAKKEMLVAKLLNNPSYSLVYILDKVELPTPTSI
ncbi:hypothetical protein J1N35_025416 [Gossypium stocksii]|uniref:Uncharacterized protein n=1 Tax=Gossypium stocksii TaxID=47602 RepID=A0A9D3V7P4_9ROSI|nr:hypothetical protein J1N35_025416 [Gossypium stocksii]